MKKVLLIDDDTITNFINETLIKNSGLANEIVIAQNGKQGLDILLERNNNRQRMPDVILLDINMPMLNGFEFLEKLREFELGSFKAIRIAVLSSSDNDQDKAKAESLGIKYYFVKPATPDFIKQILE